MGRLILLPFHTVKYLRHHVQDTYLIRHDDDTATALADALNLYGTTV
jgi:hypothetical protein